MNTDWIDKAMELADAYADCETFKARDAARAALRAHLEQRAEGEQAVASQTREVALEEAAKACENLLVYYYEDPAGSCADAIRALKEKQG